jgi:glycosyltransferase involved in cell wall biosynthesis
MERDASVVPAFFWKRKSFILPEPFLLPPLESARPAISRPAGFKIGFMAEIAPRKGLRELVEGFVLAGPRIAEMPVTLQIVGAPRRGTEQYLDGIRRWIATHGGEGRVEWLGAIRTMAERAAFYQGIDVFACPSRFESFGLTPLEALWHGTPVIMGPQIGVRQFLPDEAPVLIFTDLAPRQVAEGLRESIAVHDQMAQKSQVWRGKTMPELSSKDLAKKYLDVFAAGKNFITMASSG